MSDDTQIEEGRLAVERERLELERRKASVDERFLNRNLGTVITAIVSLAAVLVSLSQVWVAWSAKERELEQAAMRQNREWNLSILKYISENKALLFGTDNEERKRITSIILVTFPEEITQALFRKLEDSAGSVEEVREWNAAVAQLVRQTGTTTVPQGVAAAERAVRVFPHYQDEADADLVESIGARLEEVGYRVPGRQVVQQATKGDVRYFHEEDRSSAQQVASMAQEQLIKAGRQLQLSTIYLGGRFKNVPPGVIELWIPRASAAAQRIGGNQRSMN